MVALSYLTYLYSYASYSDVENEFIVINISLTAESACKHAKTKIEINK